MEKNGLRTLSITFQIFCILPFPLALRQVSAIRGDISFSEKICRNTVQGRYFLADSDGYVCTALTVNPRTRCCPQSGHQFSCQGCNVVSECCASYEYCVSCCLNPIRTVKGAVMKVKIAKPFTAGTYASVFDFCVGRCRHNSASVVHENAYASDFHHCFSIQANSSGSADLNSEANYAGVNVIVGKLGESCSLACQSKGLSCVPNKLLMLNNCEILQKYMNCKGMCYPSMGADQPAEVAIDAPKDLNPGACLFTQTESVLSCDGSHQHTKRLCPCA